MVAESLLEALTLWVNEQRKNQNEPVITFDGKVLSGSYLPNQTAIQPVTAYDTARVLVLSQKPAETKNDEINVVRKMPDISNVKGSVITVDALHCQCKR